MFKNITIYRVGPAWNPTLEAMETALDGARFIPCGATQDRSVGWVAPREVNGALVESVAGQRVVKLMVETKSVPSTTVRLKAQEAADQIEQSTGRKPGKKQMKELREDALLALLPQAFPRSASVIVWLDQAAGLLVVDTTARSKIDLVITALIRAFDGLQLTLLQTQVTPQTAMVQWLNQAAEYWPEDFHIERECELKSCDEEKSAVKFSRHNLATDEIRKHIAEGKLPTKMAMSYAGRVSFVIDERLQLKKITFLDVVFPDSKEQADSFDADVALSTGELQKLILALAVALGGEIKIADPLFGDEQ